jgi:hypothetical protein
MFIVAPKAHYLPSPAERSIHLPCAAFLCRAWQTPSEEAILILSYVGLQNPTDAQ